MLERAALEVTHLQHRRELDRKLLRAQQSKAFFLEEVAAAGQRKGESQQSVTLQVHLLFLAARATNLHRRLVTSETHPRFILTQTKPTSTLLNPCSCSAGARQHR